MMTRLDHGLPLSALMAVWVVCSAFAISREEVVYTIEQLSGGVLMAAVAGSVALFFAATIRASKRLYA